MNMVDDLDMDSGDSASDCADSIADDDAVEDMGDEGGGEDAEDAEDADDVEIAVSDYGEDDSDVDDTCTYNPTTKTFSTRTEAAYQNVLAESDGEYPDFFVASL